MARCRRSTFTNEIFCFFFSELLLYTPVHLPDTFLSTNGSQQIHVRPTEDETFSNKKKKKRKGTAGLWNSRDEPSENVRIQEKEKEKNYSHGCCR